MCFRFVEVPILKMFIKGTFLKAIFRCFIVIDKATAKEKFTFNSIRRINVLVGSAALKKVQNLYFIFFLKVTKIGSADP